MPNKLTQEQFIKKANIKHQNKYDYSLVNYVNAKTKVQIICPKHGIFEQQPSNHLFGQRCIKCMGDNVRKARKITHHDFIKKLKKRNPDTINLVTFKSEYERNDKKILLGSKYGDVLISPNCLYNGVKPCISNAVDPKFYLLNFIKFNNKNLYDKIIEITGNYVGVMDKINIKTIYGNINVTPDYILRGGNFDIRSSEDKIEYLKNYIKINRPEYLNKNIEFLSEYKGSMLPIKIKLNGIEIETCPDAIMRGIVSEDSSIGVKIKNILNKNKDKFINQFCFLYIIKLYNENEIFYKIGISTNIKQRFKTIPYSYEIIELKSSNIYDAYFMEQELHKQFKEYKYKPLKHFAGDTECFNKIN